MIKPLTRLRIALAGLLAALMALHAIAQENDEGLSRQLQELELRLGHVKAEAATAPTTYLTTEAQSLQGLHDTLLRLGTTRQRLEEEQQRLAELKEKRLLFQRQGLGEPPPYPIGFLDGLRDQLEGVKQAETTRTLSRQTIETELKSAREQISTLSQQRRAAQQAADGLPVGVELQPSPQSQALVNATLAEELANRRLELLEDQRQLAELEQQVTTLKAELLSEQISFAEPRTLLSPEELAEATDKIAQQQAALTTRLEKQRATADHSRAAVVKALEKAPADTIRSGNRIERLETVAKNDATEVEWLEATQGLLTSRQALWEIRFRLFDAASPPNDLELAELEGTAVRITAESERSREVLEAHLTEIHGAVLEQEKRLAGWDNAWGSRGEGESLLAALNRHEEAAGAYQADLLETERLARRVAERIKRQRNRLSWEDRWRWIKAWVVQAWHGEVYVTADDKAITLGALAIALSTLLGVLLIPWTLLASLKIAILRRTLRKPPADGSDATIKVSPVDLLTRLTQSTGQYFLLPLALYLALRQLPLESDIIQVSRNLVLIALVAQAAIWGTTLLLYWVEITKQLHATDPGRVSALGAFSFFGKVAIWSVVLLFSLANFGFDISTLVAGLGIGGVAVAFALQNILGDILCSVAILLDEPFQVGDFIIVGEQMGVVEHIGIKTTRIRSLWGELIVFPNTDLVSSRIRNYKHMKERRVVFKFGVIYETPPEKLAQIAAWVEHIIRGLPLTRFDRAHFASFGDYALDFEVVYYVLSPDYAAYMDLQQQINLEMLQRFSEEGVEFAYPTQVGLLRFTGQAPPSASAALG